MTTEPLGDAFGRLWPLSQAERPYLKGCSMSMHVFRRECAGVYRVEAGHYEVATGRGVARIYRLGGQWRVWLPEARKPARTEPTLGMALSWLSWCMAGEAYTLAMWRDAIRRGRLVAPSAGSREAVAVRFRRAQAQAERSEAAAQAPEAVEAVRSALEALEAERGHGYAGQVKLDIYSRANEAERSATPHMAAYDLAGYLLGVLPALRPIPEDAERPVMAWLAATGRFHNAHHAMQPVALGAGKDGQPCAAGR